MLLEPMSVLIRRGAQTEPIPRFEKTGGNSARCMKYINVSTGCYESVSMTPDNRIISFNGPLKSIGCQKDNSNVWITDKFSIVTSIGFLGTNSDANKANNPLCTNETIIVTLRLTKCNQDIEKRVANDIDSFEVDLKHARDTEQVEKACFDYYNYMRITNVNGIPLEVGPGKYVLKVLLKRVNDTEPTIQAISTLIIRD